MGRFHHNSMTVARQFGESDRVTRAGREQVTLAKKTEAARMAMFRSPLSKGRPTCCPAEVFCKRPLPRPAGAWWRAAWMRKIGFKPRLTQREYLLD